jgi:hypothetical protein
MIAGLLSLSKRDSLKEQNEDILDNSLPITPKAVVDDFMALVGRGKPKEKVIRTSVMKNFKELFKDQVHLKLENKREMMRRKEAFYQLQELKRQGGLDFLKVPAQFMKP